MKISYTWLKEYLKCDLTPEQIAETLTDIGLEVEGLDKIEAIKGGLAGVVVGEVLSCEKHPDADKLHVTTVSIGEGEPLQVVCGAPNVRTGLKTMVATVNTMLYPDGEESGFKIKKSKIRGVESFGMLCATDELGLGGSHAGIMELAEDAVVGSPASEILNIENDYLFEIGLTPNRIDAASHYGVARDLAAYLKANSSRVELILPSVDEYKVDNNSREVAVEVLASEGAVRYAGVTMTNIKVAPSPEWLQNRLRAIGLNPKNNIVDITNFILHDLGQPLHAFDADKVAGDKIIVRTCDNGAKFITLDEVTRELSSEDLMICDAEKPMCIAGVFGGMDSGVSDSTTSIFIESAYFNPVWVRKTAKRHGLNTDSSFRFERGIDPDNAIYALKRAALLVKELAGGEISSEITDLYPTKIEPFRFEISFDRVNRLIGKEIETEKVRAIITALDIVIEAENDGVLSVIVPPYRVDVQREADLIEDILRIYGYNNVEVPVHVNSTLAYAPRPDKGGLINSVSDFMTANGYTEIMSNSLTRSTYYEGLESYKLENIVKIVNPLSNDLNVMRQTLLFNAMEAVEFNRNRRSSDLKMYEFGNCYYYNDNAGENPLSSYTEKSRLAITVTGNECSASWNQTAAPTTFYTLRAAVEKILKRFGLDIYKLKSNLLESDLFADAMSIEINGKELLQMGVVSPKINKMFGGKTDVYFAEINFDLLVKATKKHKISVVELSKFPEVKRDLALLVDKNVTFAQLQNIALSADKKLLKSVTLFDVYDGDKLPEGKKSYALSFILEDKSVTLTDSVIEKVMNNLVKQFEKQCGATVRA